MGKQLEEKIKTCLALPRSVWREARIRAMDENRQFQEVVATALIAYLATPIKKEGRR